ncbi:tetratricopeptide repeat protein [Bacillus carboniphilus]|uniref:Tetratricopeptide repeat protein n=1 Tax=Bacillus carboniphilus TaxID=86663 RepID=A0ABY9JYU3_9BACI|nr:tetratricopeptide repeat protein [Bacillus carboniphilus]WLR43727.1 tetratricopeptide repeat protein [Bacillus carboniphilus]
MKQRIQEAIKLVEEGQAEQGLKIIEETMPKLDDQTKLQLAEQYYEWGLIEKAVEIVEEITLLYPEEIDISIFLAELYIDIDKEDEAIEILQRVPRHDNRYVQALVLQADLYQMQGLFEVSEKKLKEAKQINNQPIIDFALAELYFHQAYYQKAVPLYEQTIRSFSELNGVLIGQRLAESLSSLGSYNEALNYYRELNSKDPDHLFGYGMTALQAEQFETAIRQFEELQDLDPYFTSLYLQLAKSYEQTGKVNEAQETIEKGLKYDEYNKEMYFFAAKLSIKQQQMQKAIEFLRQAIALDPGYIEAIIMLSKILLQEEMFEEVIESLQEVMKFEEYDPQFDWDLAYAHHQLENYSESSNHYERAYTSFKEDKEFLQEYAFFLLEEGQKARAMQLLKKALRIEPSNVEIEEILRQLDE